MRGAAVRSGGQVVSAKHSKSEGQPALNENSTDENTGSMPGGGSLLPGAATSRRVYVEKSLSPSVRTTRSRARSASSSAAGADEDDEDANPTGGGGSDGPKRASTSRSAVCSAVGTTATGTAPDARAAPVCAHATGMSRNRTPPSMRSWSGAIVVASGFRNRTTS